MAQPPPPKPAGKSKGPPPREGGGGPPPPAPKRSESNANQQAQNRDNQSSSQQQQGDQQQGSTTTNDNTAQNNNQSSGQQQQQQQQGGGGTSSGGQASGPPPKRSQPPEQHNQQGNSGSGGSSGGGGNAPAPKRGPTPQQQQQQQQQGSSNQHQSQQQNSGGNQQSNSRQGGQQQQQQQQQDDRPVANTTIVKSGSKRIFTAEEEAEAPYGNDRTAEIVFELEGLNFALYEGLKEVDENKRRQFDNEVHQSVWSALEMLNIPPQDVHTRVGPGVISAVLLRYQAGAYPSLVDADWSIRIHAIVRLSGSNNASSIRRALQGYAKSPKPFIGVARLYQILFDQIVDRIKVEIVDPESSRPTITGSNFHSYASAPYVQRQDEDSRYATSSVREDRSYRSDRGSRPYADESRRTIYHDEEAEFEDDRRSYRSLGEPTPRRSVVREETSYVTERGSRYDDEPPRTYRTTRVVEDEEPRSYRTTRRVVEDDEYPRNYRTTRVVEERRGRGERMPRESIVHEEDDISYVSRSSAAPRSRSRPRQVRTETRYVDEDFQSSDEEAVYYNTSRVDRSPAGSTRSYRTVERTGSRGEPRYRGVERDYYGSSEDEDVVYDRRVTRYQDPVDGGREVTTYRANTSPSRMYRGQLVDRDGYTVSDGGFYVRVSEVNPRY